MLFKTHFINRLPAHIHAHVVAAGFTLTSREMADVADNLRFDGNNRQSDNKLHRWRQRFWRTLRSSRRRWPRSMCSPCAPSPRRRLPRAAIARGNSATATRSTATRHGSVRTPAHAHGQETIKPNGCSSCPKCTHSCLLYLADMPAPSVTWWTLAAPSASSPTSIQLSPQGQA